MIVAVDPIRVVIVMLLTMMATAPVYAQQPLLHHLEVSLGGGVFGAGSLGSIDANLRANSATPQPYRVFSTSSRLGAAPLLETRLAFTLTRRLSLEGRFGYSRPDVRTSVSGDVESAPAVTIIERIDQFAIDGGIKVRIDEWRLTGFTPFVTAGAGYLRQLHAGQALVEQGHNYFVGGGVTRPLVTRNRHMVKTIALRGDGRLDLLVGGIGPRDRPRPHGSFSAAIVIGF